MAYTKQGPFVNGGPPAINATRINAMDQGIYDAHQGAWSSLAIDTDTLVVDATNNRVGIGTATPSHKLHMISSGLATTNRAMTFSHTLGNGSALSATQRPWYYDYGFTATDLSSSSLVSTGVNSGMTFGTGGVGAVGTAHNFTADYVVQGNGNTNNEHCTYAAFLRSDIGTGFTQTTGTTGRYWLTDFNLHGPVGLQPNLLGGVSMFVNNYYNGTATNGSFGMAVCTLQGSGGAASATHAAAATYPVDVGFAVVGHAGNGARQGFTKGIQVGGTATGWFQSGTSRIGTGVHVRDFETHGLLINNRYSGATGPAITVESGSGPIIVGNTGQANVDSLLELTTSTTRDAMLLLRSSASTAFSISFTNSAGNFGLVLAGGAGDFFTGAAAGDGAFVARTSGKKAHLAGSTSVVAVTNANELGFHNVTPVSKRTGWGAPTGTATRTAFATTTVTTAQLAERVKALIDDLTSYGLIGA